MSAVIAGSRALVRPAGWERVLDGAAAIALAAGVWQGIESRSWGIAVVLVAGLAVILRRRFPVVAAIGAVLLSAVALGAPSVALGVWVLAEVVLFSLALRAPRGAVLAIGAAHAVLLYPGAMVVFGLRPFEPLALVMPLWTAAVVSTSLALRGNRDYVGALEASTAAANAARESEVQRRLGDERLRIARDLHDAVAHTVSIVTIHAGVAERYLDRDAEKARESLRRVRSSARDVVAELQDILTVLRAPGAETVGDVESVADLVAQAHRAGAAVEFRHDDLADIDRAVGVTVYRIVQESLTNARKHGSGPITVDLRRDATAVRVRVDNAMTSAPRIDGGFGLIGMRERAASVHGTFSAGEENGRFVVEAVLPEHRERSGGGATS
jgi:signal transduction histidine kinase